MCSSHASMCRCCFIPIFHGEALPGRRIGRRNAWHPHHRHSYQCEALSFGQCWYANQCRLKFRLFVSSNQAVDVQADDTATERQGSASYIRLDAALLGCQNTYINDVEPLGCLVNSQREGGRWLPFGLCQNTHKTYIQPTRFTMKPRQSTRAKAKASQNAIEHTSDLPETNGLGSPSGRPVRIYADGEVTWD
jgi:hypothetical protein